jgi:hypothetical protein
MERTLWDILTSFDELATQNGKLFEELFFLAALTFAIMVRFSIDMVRATKLSHFKIESFQSFFKNGVLIFVAYVLILHCLDLIDAYQWTSFQYPEAIYKMYSSVIALGTLLHELIWLFIFYRVLKYLLTWRMRRYVKANDRRVA